MPESASSVLTDWASFYIMTGSSAAALTGLMFVVITLVAGVERSQQTPDGISAFSTPTVAHFCTAFLTSAILSAPWHSRVPPATLLGIVGLYGIAYVLRVTFLTRQLTTYVPDIEDWAWFNALPLIAYGAIFAGAIALLHLPTDGLFAIGGGVVLLILIGIRNAWDVVTFLAAGGPNRPTEQKPKDEPIL